MNDVLAVPFQILIVEFIALSHLVIFLYFSAVAYEHYQISRDNPGMIDAEHKRLANKEKLAAAERKKKK